MLLILQGSSPSIDSHPIRDWSGFVITIGSLFWNIRQHYQLKNAKAQVEEARIELLEQRIRQIVTNVTANITNITRSVESGRRSEVRQQCSSASGDLAHLQTYGGIFIDEESSQELIAVGRDVQNVLITISKKNDDLLTDDEQSAIRNFSSAALVNIRASQGRVEMRHDLKKGHDAKPKTK